MVHTINLGCINDPLFQTPWCLEFNSNAWIPLTIIIVAFAIYIYGKLEKWW